MVRNRIDLSKVYTKNYTKTTHRSKQKVKMKFNFDNYFKNFEKVSDQRQSSTVLLLLIPKLKL